MKKNIIPDSMRSFYDEFHFSPAVMDGGQLRCSGVIGIDMSNMKVSTDPNDQFIQAFSNLEEVLREAGGGMESIVEMTTFHVGLNEHLSVFMKIKDRYIKDPYPAWTAIGVVELAFPNSLVEIRVNASVT